MCGFYCMVFIKLMIAGKSLLDYTINSPQMTIKNAKVIHKYLKDKYDQIKDKSRL